MSDLTSDATQPAIDAPMSVKRNFSWNAVGSAIYSAGNFAMGVEITHLGSPIDYGYYALGVQMTQPVISLAMLNLRSIYVTARDEDAAFGRYFTMRLVACLASILIFLAMGPFYHNSPRPAFVALILLVTGAGAAFDAVSDMVYAAFQRADRMKPVATSMILKGLLSPTLFGGALLLTHDILFAICGSAAASGLVMVFYDLPTLKRNAVAVKFKPHDLIPHWDGPALRALFILALPLGATVLLTSINQNMMRYFTDGYLGKFQLGIFTALAGLLMVGRTGVTALGQVLSGKLARHYHGREPDAFVRVSFKLLGVAIAVGLGAFLVVLAGGKALISFVYSPEYAKEMPAFYILLAAGVFQYVNLCQGIILTSARRFRIQVVLGLVTLVASTGLGYFLIRSGGLMGAAWATLGASIVTATAFGIANYSAVRDLRRSIA